MTIGNGASGNGNPDRARFGRFDAALRFLALVGLFLVFLGAIQGMGDGFHGLGSGLLERFFAASGNPLVGLLIGLLATTLVQSSSVTSSLIVALVAAPGSPLPFENAIPMVMGANIGTTVTNTLASLGHVRDRAELRRAFAVATCHDLFNALAVAVLLPLEIATGMLARMSIAVAGLFEGFVGAGVAYESPLRNVIGVVPVPLEALAGVLADSPAGAAAILLGFCVVLIVLSLALIVRILKGLSTGRAERQIHRALGRSAVLSMAIGAVVTMLVQSSSVTTSLLVPLAGAALIRLEDAFPLTLGANIGTTFTAFLAALAVSGPNAHWGFQLAVVHLLFNVVGILVVYPARRVRQIPLVAARWLAEVAGRRRAAAVAYVLGLFYALPALLLAVSRAFGW